MVIYCVFFGVSIRIADNCTGGVPRAIKTQLDSKLFLTKFTCVNHELDFVGCGVVWCGVVWCGVVWCGVVRLILFYARCRLMKNTTKQKMQKMRARRLPAKRILHHHAAI